jgi:Asp-tRNA(Asn)/Glu-tRNA(Gln) amidotransferase A subunit family amidase
MSLSWTMDKVGPICRTAFDCGLVLAAIQGPDGADRTVVEAPFTPRTDRSLSDLRVAFLAEAFEQDSSDIGSNDDAALQALRDLGLNPEAIALPEDFPWRTFDIILRSEAGAFFDELVRSGEIDDMVEQDYGSRPIPCGNRDSYRR